MTGDESQARNGDRSIPPGCDENPTTRPKRRVLAWLAFVGLGAAFYLQTLWGGGGEVNDESLVPPGWDENPTTWPKRIVLAWLAFVGLGVAFYLMLFQVSALYFPDLNINIVETVADPFFDSRQVLDFLKWPDAIPGVLAYGGEFVLNFVGNKNRWRTAPWTVIAFGLIIFPAAAISAVLLMVQPIFVGAWCFFCIISALLSCAICGLGADEVLATLQHLKRVRDSGGSLKRALWGEGLKGLVPIPLRKKGV